MIKKQKFQVDGSAIFSNLSQSDDVQPEESKKIGRPKNDSLVRESGSQKGLPKDLTRQTLIVSVDQIETIKNFAYTERMKVKDVVADAFKEYIDAHVDPDKLLIRPENWR